LSQGQWYFLAQRPPSNYGVLQPDTDPRAFLQALSPAADFQVVDRESIGGVELTHLRAANHNLAIPIELGAEDAATRVSALGVWVDRAGIVHRMNLTMSVSSRSFSVQSSAPPETMTQVMSLAFSQLGEPETIGAPAHATVGQQGGPATYPGIPPAPMPSADATKKA
jgi:hypothetical protein